MTTLRLSILTPMQAAGFALPRTAAEVKRFVDERNAEARANRDTFQAMEAEAARERDVRAERPSARRRPASFAEMAHEYYRSAR